MVLAHALDHALGVERHQHLALRWWARGERQRVGLLRHGRRLAPKSPPRGLLSRRRAAVRCPGTWFSSPSRWFGGPGEPASRRRARSARRNPRRLRRRRVAASDRHGGGALARGRAPDRAGRSGVPLPRHGRAPGRVAAGPSCSCEPPRTKPRANSQAALPSERGAECSRPPGCGEPPGRCLPFPRRHTTTPVSTRTPERVLEPTGASTRPPNMVRWSQRSPLRVDHRVGVNQASAGRRSRPRAWLPERRARCGLARHGAQKTSSSRARQRVPCGGWGGPRAAGSRST